MASDQQPARSDVALGDVTLSVIDEGSGPAVLLLHGWPDSADLWRHQIPALVAAGLRVIAPDLRGFGASDRPEAVDAYRVRHSVRDMVALLDHLDLDRVHVVGHDWGAPVAWLLGRFETEGNYRVTDVHVGTSFSYPPTTAVTTACVPFSNTCALQTHVSPVWVTRTTGMSNALANTLVHERVHSYGQMHGWSQKSGPNRCDAAYVMGDLAESLLRRREEGAPIVPRGALCRSLRRRLVERGIVAS